MTDFFYGYIAILVDKNLISSSQNVKRGFEIYYCENLHRK